MAPMKLKQREFDENNQEILSCLSISRSNWSMGFLRKKL